MSETKCPWCSKEMHLDAVKHVSEYENSSLKPGTYKVMHCSGCRKSFHVPQLDEDLVKV